MVAISMPTSTDRQARMRASLARLGCAPSTVTFIDGVTPQEVRLALSASSSPAIRLCTSRCLMDKAIALSHLRACRTALSLTSAASGAVLVMEDDANLDAAATWTTSLSEWLGTAGLPRNWSLVQVGVTLPQLSSWAFLARMAQRGGLPVVPRPQTFGRRHCNAHPQVWGLFSTVYSRQACRLCTRRRCVPTACR